MKTVIKNHFARMQKFTGIVLCIVFFVASGCDQSKSSLESEDGEEIIYAKVENASKYNHVVEVKLMVGNIELASGDWKDDGFTIVLPKTLDSNYLHTLIDNDGAPTIIIDAPSTLTISNKNVNVWTANFSGVDKDANVIARFSPSEIYKFDNTKSIFYTYVDSDVTISGYIEREGIVSDEYFTKYIEDRGIQIQYVWWKKINTTYSVEWKKGWNVWSLSRFYDISEQTVTEKWSSAPVSRLKWYSDEDLWYLNTNSEK